jgi:hypothetical protein
MNLLESLSMPQLEEIQTLLPLKFETLYEKAASEFFRELDPFVNQLLTEHAAFKLWYDVLGQTKRGIIKSAVIDQDFSKISDDSPDYQTVLQLLIFKNKLRHSLIKQYLEKEKPNDLSDFEIEIIKAYCDIAEATDNIFLRWRNNLFHSKLGKKVKAMEKAEEGQGSSFIKDQKLNNQYSVYQDINGEWMQMPLAMAFPEEYGTLSNVLSNLLQRLKTWKDNDEVMRLSQYFEKLQAAFACTDLPLLDASWEAVDVAWLNVHGRLQPVHAMEFNYVDPARIRVMPENRLLLEDILYAQVNENAKKTQDSLISDLKTIFHEKRSWGNSETAMKNSSIGVYIPIVVSGANLAFKFVGQSAPCREHIRIRHGSKISLNMQSCKDRFEREMRYTEAVFGKETKDSLFSTLTPEENISLRSAAHEVAHAAFVDEHTTERVGSGIIPLLEEAKATWGEYATIDKRIERGELTASAKEKILLLMVAANMRYLTIKHETTLQPYYNAALMELNTMIEVGLITKSEEQFSLNMDKMDAFYSAMKEMYHTMVKIYDEYDAKLAKQLLEEKGKETPIINEMHEIVKQVV